MKGLLASILTFTLLMTVAGSAQETLRPRIEIFGGLSWNLHSADFRALPGVPNCCPQFDNGSGFGPIFGVAYEFPVAGSLLLSLGMNYVDHSALLSTRESVAIVSGGELRDGAFEHTIDASIGSIGIEPTASYRLIEGLFVRGGIRIGLLLSPTYSQREEIIEPTAAGTFLDPQGNDSGERIRNASAGAIPNASSLLLHGMLGAEYELPMNSRKTLLLTPGVSYGVSFTDIVEGYSWKPNGLRLMLGVKYSPLPAKTILRDTTYRRDTTIQIAARGTAPSLTLKDHVVTKDRIEEDAAIVEHVTVTDHYLRIALKTSILASTITSVGVDRGKEEPAATLRIEEFLQTKAHPLLGYIFFDEGSAEIPIRYSRLANSEAEKFQPKTLFGEDAIGISHNVLNVIGYNLREHPEATLTITGCNANSGVEQANRTLSGSRAKSVKDYLINVWKIGGERLSIVERNLPEVPSNIHTTEGAEENRRVEIASDIAAVTDLFIAHDTTRTASPPTLRFKPAITSSEPVASWRISISQHGSLLKEFSGTGNPPSSVDWEIATEKGSIPRFSDPLTVELQGTNSDGETTTSQTTLATDLITIQRKEQQGVKDYRIEQYSLVLFDVGKATITEAHRRTIELIRSRLKPGSIITVEGYSDRTGDADANRRLALSRAQATAKALGRPDANVVGIGEDRLLHSNDVPEGRFYCRTVQIIVKTPVER